MTVTIRKPHVNVLILTPTVGRAGICLVTRKLLQALSEQTPAGWRFSVLGQQYAEDHERVIYPADFKFTQLEPVDKLPAHPNQFAHLWFSLGAMYNHVERVASQADVIFCISPFWLLRAYSWNIAAPLVTYIPDFAFDDGVFAPGLTHHFRDATCKIQQRAAMTIFTANHHRHHAIDRYGFDPAKTRVVPFPAEIVADNFCASPEEAARVREIYDLPERYVVAFHPMHSKDPMTILKAMHIARNRLQSVPPLVLAGINTDLITTDAPVDEHIQEVRNMIRAADLRIGRDLFILGKIPESDIGGLFAGATASISASTSEGQLSGNTLSAFLAKCPHLYSALPVYLESIGRGVYGYDFEVGDIFTLSALLMEVCSDPVEPQRRAELAYAWAQGRTMADVAREYLEVFRSVIDGK